MTVDFYDGMKTQEKQVRKAMHGKGNKANQSSSSELKNSDREKLKQATIAFKEEALVGLSGLIHN